MVPRSRKGALQRANLQELRDYGREHPTVQKVSPGTVNKQLGAVQAIAGWSRHSGLVPEDAQAAAGLRAATAYFTRSLDPKETLASFVA